SGGDRTSEARRFRSYRRHRREPSNLRQRSRGRHGSGVTRTLRRGSDRDQCRGGASSTSSSGAEGVWRYRKVISGISLFGRCPGSLRPRAFFFLERESAASNIILEFA